MSVVASTARHTRMLLTGDYAAAYAALRARPSVIPVYPITPQTPLLEKLAELADTGALTGDVMTVESEHSAMAACIAASTAGVRVFTATASQGLALMHEMLHYAAGARAPVVMVNVNRSLASPWSFWADQTDSLAQRDTGWMQLYCESPQEALDSVLLAYRVAESVLLPAMVVIEAMYVSHALEPVDVPDTDLVAEFLPPFEPLIRLDPDAPRGFGGTATPAQWRANRLAVQAAMTRALAVATEAGQRWGELTGRAWAPVEGYRADDADLLLLIAGSIAGTARAAVDRLRDEGVRVGLLKLRLFRPFPGDEVLALCRRARRVGVVDRNYSPGCGGIVGQEVRAALHAHGETAPGVVSYVAGVGGVNVSVDRLAQIVRDLERRETIPAEPIVEEAL
jgi:pyruvate/2-oxoacid:ferredoxin oxidoreductase alpha subunit